MKARVLRGWVVNFAEDAVTDWRKGAVVVGNDGRIAWVGAYSRLPKSHAGLPVDDYGDSLILPGLIDPHIHFPQYRMLAAPGKDLLDWLNRFTFPEEARYKSRKVAAAAAERFLDRLLANGTTSALAFCSVHKTCADALFSAALDRNMALITGKTMMDCNAPDGVLDDAATGARDSASLIGKWHNRARLRYAITPRFAVTSTEAQLRVSGELLSDHPDCLMQTHISESPGEIAFVAEQFGWSKDYTDVYDRFGLLGPTSVFAHGIHLSERECARMSETGSSVIHCPTSNTFLGSGLFRYPYIRSAARPVGVGIATDVGGGTSYSMLQTLGEAYKVGMLVGHKFTAADLFAIATQGNAERLHLGDEIGKLTQGNWADAVVLDPAATATMAARNELSRSLEDVLFSLIILGDDRSVRATYVAGKRVHGRRPR
jgi:guanine deaminase